MTVCAHLRATGRVQGVFFRMEVAEQARRLGATGWVRNCPDGSVEAWIEGEQATVDHIVQWCHHGPTAARVDDVAVTWETPEGNLTGFEIH